MGEWMCRPSFSWPRHYLEVSGQLHSPAAYPGIHWIGGWVGHSRSEKCEEKILGPTATRTRTHKSSSPLPVDIPTYQLRYPGSTKNSYKPNKNGQVWDKFKLLFTLKCQNWVLHWTGAQLPGTMQWTPQTTWKSYILFLTNKTNLSSQPYSFRRK
jgi:hypothetical protein